VGSGIAEGIGGSGLMAHLFPELLLAAQTELGECPVWDPARRLLWFMDITERKLHTFGWQNQHWTQHALPALGGGLVLAADGSLIAGLQTGIHRFEPETGDLTFIVDPEPGKPDYRLNEAKCDPQGRFWVGSISTLGRFPTGCLYRLETSGEVVRVLEEIAVPNTLVWLPDGLHLVFADSARRIIWRFRYDPESGALSERAVYADCTADRGIPDGAALDAEGHLWIAEFGGGHVKRYDPKGQVVQIVDLPATQVTSCAFAGPNLAQLVIITTKRLLDPAARATQAHAGDLFVVEPEVPGVLPHLFATAARRSP
jgi:sugar lactone lactonase YvrE